MDNINSIEKNSARIHKFFDKGIFWESFKQQKIPGILISSIYLAEVVLMFFNALIKNGKNEDYYSISYYANPSSLHPILSLTFLIAAPVLVLVAFHFLTKRTASDFWLSLPQKRETVFTSIFLAVSAWLVVIIVGTSIVSMTMGLFISDNIPTYLLVWLFVILTYLIQSLLMAACFTLAATLTGTVWNNIIIGLLIAFGPSLFLLTVSYTLISTVPILTYQSISSFLSGEYNILAARGLSNFFLNSFELGYDTYSGYRLTYAPLIYSFFLAVVYVIIACILFKKRKSENAGQSSLNRKIHTLFRVALCMVVCVLMLTLTFVKEIKGTSNIYYSYLTCFIASAVVYFVYDLIKTNNLKNVFWSLGIVLIINISVYGLITGVRSYALNYNPSAEKIKSVSVMIGSYAYSNTDNFYYKTGDTNVSNYLNYHYMYENAANEVFLEDEEVKKIVSEALKENIEKAKGNKDDYFSYFRNKNRLENRVNERYSKVKVNINTGIITKNRYIFIKDSDLYRIREIYFNKKEFQKTVLTPPKKISTSQNCFETTNKNFIGMKINGDDLQKIYKQYREEIANCSFDDFRRVLESGQKVPFYIRADNYYILKYHVCNEFTPEPYETFMLKYPVCNELTPKTYEMVMEAFSQSEKKDE